VAKLLLKVGQFVCKMAIVRLLFVGYCSLEEGNKYLFVILFDFLFGLLCLQANMVSWKMPKASYFESSKTESFAFFERL